LDGFNNKLIEEIWLKPISLLVLIGIGVLGSMYTWPTSEDKSLMKLIVYIIVVVIIISVYVVCMINHNKLPRVKKGKLGILFIINTDNKKQSDDIERKLVDKFEEIIRADLPDTFKIIYLSKDRVKKYDLQNKEMAKKLLNKVNCLFETSIKILADDSDDASKYQMSIDNGILHATYIEWIQKKFNEEFMSATKFTRCINFRKDNKIEILEVTATQLVLVCKYVLGLSYLYNGQIELSEVIMESLHKDIFKIKNNIGVARHLKDIMPNCCYEIHMIKALLTYQEYRTKKEVSGLAAYKEALTEANAFMPGTYDYYLNMAIYYMFARRDVKKSKEQIKMCATFKSESSWRYSDAFLYAYEGKGELTLYGKYKQAFRKNYDLAEIAWFIEEVYELEPEKHKLLFALGMVYSELGQYTSAKESFQLFWDKYDGTYEYKQKIKLLIKERIPELPESDSEMNTA